MRVDGGCHCGRFHYEADIDPERVGICHCTDCQTLTGSAFRVTVQAPAERFTISGGEPSIYIKTADSGNKRAHAFCPDCGSPLYAAALENTPTYSLRLGALNQRALLTPRRQIWCDRALPWVGEITAIDSAPRG